ncbi:hypothetical protein ANMWB30_24920 [Arthrobacter sp. MWB30]|nr:hypothetical protein ANMWB30_24920 [Arthrobacter sp. MWB30]
MQLDLRSPEERAYAHIMKNGERHQLNWLLEDGSIRPKLRCLHGNLPERFSCAAQILVECPELLTEGYRGAHFEARDGIIVSRWVNVGYRYYWSPDPEFTWHYESDGLPGPVMTQRHTVRFTIGQEHIEPVFECLHPEGPDCDASIWREETDVFAEWYAGPNTAMRTGAIVSWWSSGQPNDNECPYWAYEDDAALAITRTQATDHG